MIAENQFDNELTNYIVSQLPYGLLIEDTERKIHSVNYALLNIFEIEAQPEDLKGFDCILLADQVGDKFTEKNYFFEVIAGCLAQKLKKGPFYFKLHNGKHVELTYIPYYNSENIFFGHSWCYADVTEQKKTETLLEVNTKFFKNILDSIPADIVLFNPKHEYVFINKKAIADPELREWMVNKKDEDYCTYRNKPLSIAQERRLSFNKVLATKKSYEWEDKIIDKDGKTNYVLRILHPFLNSDKDIEFVLGYGIDLTAFKAKTIELIAQETKNIFLQNHIKGIVFSTDKDLNIKAINPAWESITNFKISNTINNNLNEYIEEITIKNQVLTFVTDKTKEELNLKFKLKISENDFKWVDGYLFKDTANFENDQSYWGFLNDIDNQIKEQENLVSEISKEKELNELKSRFVNMVSHEVRTPLAGILSSVELLEIINQNTLPELTEKNKRHFGRIKDQILKIGDLMNDVLLLGKIESGSLEINLEEIDLTLQLNSFLNENFNSEDKNGRIKLITKGKNKLIRLDWKLMYHVFTNLISNSLKYSLGMNDPELTLIFEKDKLRIEMQDYGIGIPAKDLVNLFTPFTRGSNVSGINGTGLGLVLVKYFVELHKGSIQISSEVNFGTKVEIVIGY